MSRALYTASYISIADLSLGFFNLSRLIFMQDKLKAKNKTSNVIRTHSRKAPDLQSGAVPIPHR